jgi:hypothetical protein
MSKLAKTPISLQNLPQNNELIKSKMVKLIWRIIIFIDRTLYEL